MHDTSRRRVRAEKLPLFEEDGRTPYDPARHTLRAAVLRTLRRAYRALRCQSAWKRDPGSASNRDPPVLTGAPT